MKEEIWEYSIKRLTNTETENSESRLNDWLSEKPSNRKEFEQVKELWRLTGKTPANKFNNFDAVEHLIQQKPPPQITKQTNWWYSIAAVTVGALILCGVFFVQHSEKPKTVVASIITKKANAGEILKLVLPDSSTIWLNSGSEISFSENLELEDKRTINLTGEAYFEVKHDEKHPFIVKSAALSTTVYGTSFNVRAYRNEETIAVAVNSGKVGVNENLGKQETQFLLPKSKLMYQLKSHSFIKKTIALKAVNSWIQGELIFDETPIEDVLFMLSRKYNVSINSDQLKTQGCKLTAEFKNKSLADVLETLKLVMDIKSEQIDKTIYLEGGSACK